MADLKISQLTAISVLTPATDVLPVVDVGGVTKKIQVNQILASNGVAALASATITGALTVDTTTLVANAAGYTDKVGVGTATPTAALHVSSSGSVHVNQRTGGNGCFTQYIDPTSSNYVGTDSGNFRVVNNSAQDILKIEQLGVFTFGDGAGGTRMTLNSTGLGIGGSASSKLTVTSAAGVGVRSVLSTGTTTSANYGEFSNTGGSLVFGIDNSSGSAWTSSAYAAFIGSNTATNLHFLINGATKAVLDASGNLLVGLATAGTTAAKTIQIANGTAPTANVTGGQLYVESGALKYRGSSGTITTLGAA